MLSFIRYAVGLRFSEFSFLALKDPQQVHSRRAPHLLEPLNRHYGSKRLASAFDNELVVAKRDTTQDSAESLANLYGRNFLGHSNNNHKC